MHAAESRSSFRAGRAVGRFLLWTIAFALAYAPSPLYTSNQNQYFLHGLARAGVGFLRDDWLANTLDPTPVFSALVEGTHRLTGPWAFQVEYALLMGVYLFSLAAILESLSPGPWPRGRKPLILAGLVLLHSAALRYLLGCALGPEGAFVLEGGVAGQRLLGQVLQPSSFGVGLVASVALFLRGRPRAAALAAAATATVHPTYLLTAALLVGAFLWSLLRQPGGSRRAAGTGALALAAVLPITIYAAAIFRPSGQDIYALATDILIRQRIPHHAIPAKWLDITVAIQAGLILLALVRLRRSNLFTVLSLVSTAAVVLTLVQVATKSSALALLFPWRAFSLVVPIATAVLLGWLVEAVAQQGPARWLSAAATAGMIVLMALGVYRYSVEVQQQRSDPAEPMMAFVADHLGPGQVYLIPPKLQDFRLRTGAPIVVDSKAIPYRDVEVVEWFDRLRLARLVYRSRPEYIGCNLFDAAADEYGATHVAFEPEQLPLACPRLGRMIYDDNAYTIVELR